MVSYGSCVLFNTHASINLGIEIQYEETFLSKDTKKDIMNPFVNPSGDEIKLCLKRKRGKVSSQAAKDVDSHFRHAFLFSHDLC